MSSVSARPALFWVDDSTTISRIGSMIELQQLGAGPVRAEVTTYGALGTVGPRPLSPSLVDLVLHASRLMRAGWVVELRHHNGYLTTQQAADFLEISRPALIRLLDKGAIPYQRVGNRRRLYLSDVDEYEERTYPVDDPSDPSGPSRRPGR